ncbi:hypothetical protein R1sor_005710 [Riccia sorocarpa]|uniref:Uncharacterized protein n=1 Tax=Riccia sorocarpa TaxID=122646 RepID=A0ABD3HRU4_9MARC
MAQATDTVNSKIWRIWGDGRAKWRQAGRSPGPSTVPVHRMEPIGGDSRSVPNMPDRGQVMESQNRTGITNARKALFAETDNEGVRSDHPLDTVNFPPLAGQSGLEPSSSRPTGPSPSTSSAPTYEQSAAGSDGNKGGEDNPVQHTAATPTRDSQEEEISRHKPDEENFTPLSLVKAKRQHLRDSTEQPDNQQAEEINPASVAEGDTSEKEDWIDDSQRQNNTDLPEETETLVLVTEEHVNPSLHQILPAELVNSKKLGAWADVGDTDAEMIAAGSRRSKRETFRGRCAHT